MIVRRPVDADRELFAVQAAPQPGDFRMRSGANGLTGEFLRIDSNGKYLARKTAMLARATPVMGEDAERIVHIAKKVVAIVLGLEADQIVGKHRFDKFAVMRDALKYGLCGPGCMQEKPERLLDA